MKLSKREKQCAEAIRKGLSNAQGAFMLGVQECTFKVHVKNVMKKLGSTNRTQVAIIADRLYLKETVTNLLGSEPTGDERFDTGFLTACKMIHREFA